MKRATLFVLLFSTVCSISLSQNTELTKFSIGTNAASLIKKDAHPTLLLNYNFHSNNHARVQVGYSNTSGNLETDIGSLNTLNNGLNGDTVITNSPFSRNFFTLQIGYFRTTELDDKFAIYFGLDAVYRHTNNRSELNLKTKREFSPSQIQFFDTHEKLKTNITSIGVAPVFGIQYNLSTRIQLGFEINSLVLSTVHKETINRKTVQSSSFDPRIFESHQEGTNGWNEVTHAFNPMSGLFLSYRL